jgi:hypothetical protein
MEGTYNIRMKDDLAYEIIGRYENIESMLKVVPECYRSAVSELMTKYEWDVLPLSLSLP